MKPQTQRLCLLGIDTLLALIAFALIRYPSTDVIPYAAQTIGILFLIFAIPSGFMLIRGYIRERKRTGAWL